VTKKPPNPDEELQAQIKALLVRVGDFNSLDQNQTSLEENLEGLGSVLGDELGRHGEFLSEFVVTCSLQLSMQTPVYGTLIGLLNARDEDFGVKVIRKAANKLGEMLAKGRWVNAKLILRFIAELTNARVVKAAGDGSFGELLTNLLKPLDSTEEEVPRAMKDFYAHMVLSTLPWVAETLSKEWPDGFPPLIRKAVEYAESRAAASPFRVGGLQAVWSDMPVDEEDEEEEGEAGSKFAVLDSLQLVAQVGRLLEKSLEAGEDVPEINAIFKPWRSFKDEVSQGRKHTLPKVILPSVITPPLPFNPIMGEFPIYRAVTSVEAATVVNLEPLERFVLKEYVKDMFITFRPFVNEAGLKRGSFKAEAEQLLSIAKSAPGDCHTEFLVVETLLNFLLHLPGRDLAYIHHLFLDIQVELKNREVQQNAVALGVYELWQNLDCIDPLASRQLADWLASHFSNTQFVWPFWEVWQGEVVQAADTDERKVFARRLLDVASRLNYPKLVKEKTGMDELVPSEPYSTSPFLPADAKEEPEAGDSAPTAFLKELVRQLRAVIEGSMDVHVLRNWLYQEHGEVHAVLGADDSRWRPRMAMHAIARLGDTTISHLCSAIENGIEWLREMADDEEDQAKMIEATFEAWEGNPQMRLMMFNSMMRLHVILPSDLLNWVLSPENLRRFGRDPSMWDLLSEAMERSLESVDVYAQQVQQAFTKAQHMGVVVDVNDDATVRRFVQQETLENGSVAVENAEDMINEIVLGLIKV